MMNFVHKAACVTIFFLEVVNNVGCSDSMPTIMSFTPTILVSGKINLFNDTQLACCLDQLTFCYQYSQVSSARFFTSGLPNKTFSGAREMFFKTGGTFTG